MLIDRENKSWENVHDFRIQNVLRIQYVFSKLTHSNTWIEIFDFFKSLRFINNYESLHFEHHDDQHRFTKKIHFFWLHDEYIIFSYNKHWITYRRFRLFRFFFFFRWFSNFLRIFSIFYTLQFFILLLLFHQLLFESNR